MAVTTPDQPAAPQAAPALVHEKPLSPAKRGLIALGIALILLLGYLFCALSLVWVAILFLLDIALVIPGLRIGMAGYFAAGVVRQGYLASYLLRSLRLQEATELNVPLERAEAPALFEMLEELARQIDVPPPADVRLVPEMNAWVRVRGYRSARKGSTVGIGFDLLAATTSDEMRAILAHELAHAKLLQPGFQGWLHNAMQRMGQTAAVVAALDRASRQQGDSFYTAAGIASGLNFLGRSGSRLVALHSRQHEFAADAIAARIAGAAPFRNGLMRVHLAEQAAGDLDHRDKLIQSQKEESFTQWLQQRLVVNPEDEAKFREKALAGRTQNTFDSHPALSDRLSAIPEPADPAPASQPAMSLFVDADKTAARLLTEMEQLLAKEEKKENESLLREIRKSTTKPAITGVQWLVILVQIGLVVTLIISIIAAVSDSQTGVRIVGAVWCAFLIACMVGTVYLYRLGRRREKAFLPSPAYSLLAPRLEEGPHCKSGPAAVEWRNASLAAHPAYPPPQVPGNRAQADWWGDRAFEAIGIADYRAAYAFAYHAVNVDRSNLKARLAMPIVAAAVGDEQQAATALESIFKEYPLGASVSWCAGWCFAFQEEWEKAEAYLHDAATRRSADPGVWALLGYCQWQRDKIRESVNSFGRAIYLRPDDQAQQLLLARILLDSGRPREAEQLLGTLDTKAAHSLDAMIARVRLHLLLGRTAEAKAVAKDLETRYPTGKAWLAMGRAYHEAKAFDLAEPLLRGLRDLGFYPDGLVVLASVLHEKKSEEWKTVLLEAIDMQRKPAPDAAPPQQVLKVVCRLLAAYREPAKCQARLAQLGIPNLGFDFNGLSLVVAAENSEAANAQVHELWQAMHGFRQCPAPTISWRLLPKESQPDNDMPPGIYELQLEQRGDYGWVGQIRR